MVYVDNSQITPLYANTSPGLTADAGVIDPAIAAMIVAINTNADIYTAFVTALELPIPDQSIVTRHLRNLAVTNPKLAPLAVTADKIADGSITLAKLADLVVTAAKIANGTITEPKMADYSVSRRMIIPGSVGTGEIDPSILNPITDANVQIQLLERAKQLDTVNYLKARAATIGEVYETKGYYSIGDNGHGLYQIVSSGTENDGSIIALNNGLFAKLLHNGQIRARQFGVKLDNTTDDTARLNAFFGIFGTADLIVDNGVAKITGQLNLNGTRNSSSNNGNRTLKFINAALNYQGPSGKACMQIYNHQRSIIEGLYYLSSSVSTYINFAAVWYSKILNFQIPKITFNKTNSDIPDTLFSTDCYTNVFSKGISYDSTDFYGSGVSGAGNVNSLSFKDVLWNGGIISTPYNLKFYGTSFQNLSFSDCDISYATTANIYIDVAQTTMKADFRSCYFDSQIALVDNRDFKGASINMYGNQIANSQKMYVKGKNLLSNTSLGNFGDEGGTPKSGGLNLARNGDLQYALVAGWQFNGSNVGGTSPTLSFLTNTNTINGNSLQIVYAESNQYVGFNGVTVPMDGKYTAAIRLKKKSGNGTLQLSFNPSAPVYDLTPYAINEEIIISAVALKTQGAGMFASLISSGISSPLTIEVMEVTITVGTNIGINLPMYPSAVSYPTSGTTAQRPTYSLFIGRFFFDTTLGKPIWWNGTVWKDATGTTV